jgi:hypothetical protein
MAWNRTIASSSFKAWLCALVCLFSAGLAPANDWYAAPNGTPTGNGSISNPWDLDTALGTESCTPPAAIQPGDTLWLLPGTYNASMSGGFQSCLTGTAAAPIVVRNYGGGRATIDGFGTLNTLYVAGAYTWFWGIEFMDHNPVRSSSLPGSNHQPNSLGPGIYGPGIKFINCVVHDTGYGFSGYALATGLEIYGSLAYYIGYTAPDQNHGYGVYAQNTNGTKLIADNFIGDNADEGIQVYGDTGSLIGITLQGNTAYNAWSWPVPNYQANILMGGGTTAYGNSILENMSYFTLSQQSGSINIGQYSASYNIDVEDNIFVGGGNTITVEGVNSPFTFFNNTLVNLPSGFNSTTQEQVVFGQLPGQGISGYNWGNNSYYGANLFEIGSYNGLALSNGSSVSFTQWQSDGFDTHSTLVSTLPAGKWVYVRPNQYEAKRANITIYNWDAYDASGNVVLGKSPTVSVDLSRVLAPGDNFIIQDVQNFYGPPVVSGIYAGGTVTIPMEGLAKAAPIGFVAPAHTAPAFGTFIVMLSSAALPPGCPCTIWSNTAPTVADNGPDSPVELGVKFTSSVNGAITGVRFYKSGNNTGTHIGNLWDSQGNNLASATFTNETASGWQQVTFSSAVNITANTIYVASYHTNVGHYSADQNYFATSVSSPPLQFLAGPKNGVYGYGTSAFPGNSYNSTNYWVDVVFSTTVVYTPVPNVVGNTQAAASVSIPVEKSPLCRSKIPHP